MVTLVVVAGLVFVSVAPAVGGWRATVVPLGSTAPAVRPGDVVVAAPVPARDVKRLARGSVVLVRDRAGRLVTKEGARVAPRQIVGLVRLRVPAVGLPVVWVRERRTVPLLCLAGVLALIVTSRSGRRPRRPAATARTPRW